MKTSTQAERDELLRGRETAIFLYDLNARKGRRTDWERAAWLADDARYLSWQLGDLVGAAFWAQAREEARQQQMYAARR